MYSKNDYRNYLEHRLAESDDYFAHYGVKGMKWKQHVYARKYKNEEEPDSMVYEAGNKNREVYGVTFKDKKYGNSVRIGHTNKKKRDSFDPKKDKYKSKSKRITKRITKTTDNSGRTMYDIELGSRKQLARSGTESALSRSKWAVQDAAYQAKKRKKK